MSFHERIMVHIGECDFGIWFSFRNTTRLILRLFWKIKKYIGVFKKINYFGFKHQKKI